MDCNDNIVLSTKRKHGTEHKSRIPEFVPHTFLQCHDDGMDCKDFDKQVWCCKFCPESNDIFATCGGETLCMIDANSTRVIEKFTQPNEEFYTLDWTKLKLGATFSNVIACGGCLGFVYLINTEQFCAYGFFKAHSKPVQTLTFVPEHPTLLLTAGNEKKIYLWDIGIPSLPDYNFSHKKLAIFENLDFSPLKMITFKQEYLFCASEGGLFCWHAPDVFQQDSDPKKNFKLQRFNKNTEIQFLFVNDETLVDGLTVLDDDLIATKCAQVGVIFIWRPGSLLKKINDGRPSVTPSILRELKWSNTQQYYINIAACQNKQALFAGDEKGSIWIYDCKFDNDKEKQSKHQKMHKSLSLLPGHTRSATQILQWPICTRSDSNKIDELEEGTVLNDICCSSDMKFIVAVADNNLVCIYKSKC